MSIFDFISKPIKSASPLTMLPKPEVTPFVNTPIIKNQVQPTSFITKPISTILTEAKTGISETATKTIGMKIPEPKIKVVMNWADVANIIPTLVGQNLFSPIISGALSLAQVAKENLKLKTGIDIPIPEEINISAFGKDRGNFIDSKSSQKFFEEQIASGVPEDKAFWNTAIKTVGDISQLVPLAQGLTKSALLKIAPEKLINPEILTANRDIIRDFLTGRRTTMDLDIPQPLKEAITETLKTGTREEKIRMLGGIDILQAKPSHLGKMLGITQEEATSILTDVYGGPIRPTATAALPGYTTDQPSLKMGLSIEKRTPVGFGTDEIPKDLKPLAEEAKKYKSAEEFVKAQGTPLYHGGAETIGEFKNMGERGVYLTPDKKMADIHASYASKYGKYAGGKPQVTEAYVSPKKVYKIKKGSNSFTGIENDNLIEAPQHYPDEISSIKAQGFDAIQSSDGRQLLVFNPSQIKTKSQLTDFYNKAVGETKSPVSLQPEKDVSKPTDPEQRLVEATKDLPVQKMETGFKAIDEIMPSFEKENRELTDLYAQEDSSVAREVSDITNLLDNKDKAKAHIDSLKMEVALKKEFLLDDPARQLSKYSNKRTTELPEVTGNPTSIFAQKGDDIVTELGFKDSEEARAAYQKYLERRERYLKTKKNLSEVAKDFTEKKQILEAVTKKLRKEGIDRKRRIDSIQEFFNLTDAEMKDVTKGLPDYRLITEERFNNILKGLEGKAFEAFQLSEARAKVEYTIFDKELIKVDNLLKAKKLPEIKNMSRKQLLQLNELLRSFKAGDEFLGVRQLETVQNTDIANVKTKREVLEDLAKRTGMPYSELLTIKIGKFDRYLYDVALARQSPFHRIMVEDTSKAFANANVRYFEFKDKLNKLMQRARASKNRSFIDRLVPTDNIIFDYLDSDSATKLELLKRMTPDEINAARFIQDKYAEVRDYLVSKGQLDKYRINYITHIERGFLEAMYNAIKPVYINGKRITTENFIKRTARGVFDGLKEMLTEYKQQEAIFNIMNQKTGEVLPLEKFFKFSMKRTGELVPTRNVSKAVLSYMQAFEKKVALDSIVPKIDIYAHSITPNGMTKRGLELDDSVKRFVKEWLNTKRGRVADTLLVTPGGPIDWALRSLIGFTRMLDLGVNVPVGIASNLGEQVMTAINIGFIKTGLGVKRSMTPQGKKISQKYAGFVGERMIDKLIDTSKDIGDKFSETIFGLFSDASRRANIEHLLGSMTPQEFAKGEISAERLGQLRLEIGKYRVIDQGESVVGKTAIGKAFTQYKSWAVGSLYSTLHNLNVLSEMAFKDKNVFKTREFQELFRGTLMLAFIGLTAYGTYSRLRDKKDRSFLEQLAFKSMNDSLSMIGALNPSLWGSPTRVQSFITDLTKSISDIITSLATGERTKQDKNIKGLNQFIHTFTPSLVRTIKSIPFENLIPKKTNAKLQGIKLTPRVNNLGLVKTKLKSNLKGIKLVPKKTNIKIQ